MPLPSVIFHTVGASADDDMDLSGRSTTVALPCYAQIQSMGTNTSDNSSLDFQHIDTFEQITRGLYVYGIPVICFFGIFGNMLSFKVFVFTGFGKQSSSIYTAALSLSDTGFLLILFLSWLGGGRIGVNYGNSPVWCHLMIFITYVCACLSVWYVVLIMIDRYIVVCHSLHVSQWCSKTRSKIAAGIVTSFGVLVYAHTFFTTEVTDENCTVRIKSFMNRRLNIFIYADTAITFIIPFGIIFVMNIIVLISIKRFQTRHVAMQNGKPLTKPLTKLQSNTNVLSKAQVRITQTFILVSIVLLLTNLPSHGIRFYILVKQVTQETNTVLAQAQQICQIMYYINFSINFLLYSVSCKMFRKYLAMKYFCYCYYKRRVSRGTQHLYG